VRNAASFHFDLNGIEKRVTSETPILPNVARGEPTAIIECLRRYENLVWALARRSCPDNESAEDAVQEIFFKLWKFAARFDEKIASETTFVAMIARRCLIDLKRKKSSITTSTLEFESLSSAEMGVSKRLELNDEAAKAAELLNELPDAQKCVIRLSVYDGLSHSRIAEKTGMSLGTVKTHIRRGMTKLRQSLFTNDETSSFNSSLVQGEFQ
jgi:RNA polymerase sigma-70 factor (ECF subfamily)